MTCDVTQILGRIEQGEPKAAEELLPGQTLQATALVHEAYLRLVDTEQVRHWNSRGHFFAAAAEAMRRILVENARRKKREKHAGEWNRVDQRGDLLRVISLPQSVVVWAEAA